jgi:hypothetical protein
MHLTFTSEFSSDIHVGVSSEYHQTPLQRWETSLLVRTQLMILGDLVNDNYNHTKRICHMVTSVQHNKGG